MIVTDAVGMAAEVAPHDVFVLELFEQTNLSNGGTRDAFIFRLQPNLLEGDDFVRGHIASFVHDAISSWENDGGLLDVRWPGLWAQDTFACGQNMGQGRQRRVRLDTDRLSQSLRIYRGCR